MPVSKEVVLSVVKRLRRATSMDVAFHLFSIGFRCSRKTVSMRLKRYFEQGLLGRAMFGRSGFAYRIKPKGEGWLRFIEERKRRIEDAASQQVAEKKQPFFFDKDFEDLMVCDSLGSLLSESNQPSAQNEKALVRMVSNTDAEMYLFDKLMKEHGKRVQCEVALEVLLESNRLLRQIIRALFPGKSSVDFELGRKIGRIEAEGEQFRAKLKTTSMLRQTSLNKQSVYAHHQKPTKILEITEEPLTQEHKPSTPAKIEDKKSEHEEREPEADWEDFNNAWWLNLRW